MIIESLLCKRGIFIYNGIMYVCNTKLFKDLKKNTDLKRLCLDKDFSYEYNLGKILSLDIKEDGFYCTIELKKKGIKELKKYNKVALCYRDDINRLESISFCNQTIFD